MEILALMLLLQVGSPGPPIQNAKPPASTASQPAQQTQKPAAIEPQKSVAKRAEQKPTDDASDGQRHRKRVVRWLGFDWELADFINLGIAIGTLATFFTAIAAVRRASTANATALAAAKDASENAIRTLSLTEDSVQLVHRPSLHLETITLVSGTSNADPEIRIDFVLRNTGTDTAQAVMIYVLLGMTPGPTRDDLDREIPIQKQGDIGAGMPQRILFKRSRDTLLGSAINSGAAVCSLVVTYRDEFRNHYRLSVMERWHGSGWETQDEWRKRTKVTPETDKNWDRL